MSKVSVTLLVAVWAATACSLSLAQSTQSRGGNYMDELAKKDAQLALLRKEIELRDARQLLAGGVSGLPLVQSVSGFDGSLTATLKYPNGRKVNVRRGQQLPGGMQVRDVSRSGVIVRVASIDAALEFDSGRDVSAGHGQEKTPSHLLPPVPQVNVPLPASLMPAATAPAAVVTPQAVAPAPQATVPVEVKK